MHGQTTLKYSSLCCMYVCVCVCVCVCVSMRANLKEICKGENWTHLAKVRDKVLDSNEHSNEPSECIEWVEFIG